jgi:hypothetical protein
MSSHFQISKNMTDFVIFIWHKVKKEFWVEILHESLELFFKKINN